MALTPDQIASLLASTRTKGQYAEFLGEFLASGESGVNANEQWVAISGKKATTVKQGFESAKDKKDAPDDARYVKVLVSEDQVYLINLKAAGVDLPAESGATEGEQAAA